MNFTTLSSQTFLNAQNSNSINARIMSNISKRKEFQNQLNEKIKFTEKIQSQIRQSKLDFYC